MENPFERYDLDPRAGIGAITQRLKELAEDAPNDGEREAIRAAWEELTLHPARRLRAALFAPPETREPLGAPPGLPRTRASTVEAALDPGRLAPRPSLLATLALAAGEGEGDGSPEPLAVDPVLRPVG